MEKISIDATNIKAGGGLTHLRRLLEFNNEKIQVEVIGGSWLKNFPAKRNLDLVVIKDVFNSLFKQERFKYFKLREYLSNSDIAFIPGGTFYSRDLTYVSMSQNMLVFEKDERNRFPVSIAWIRYLVLEYLQLRSFKHAAGIIYISYYAKNFIESKYPILKEKKSKVIYHGISNEFRQLPKRQKFINEYSSNMPLRILYVSIVNYYKHQWNVIEAVKLLRKKGYPIELDLVGALNKSLAKKFAHALSGTKEFVKYRGSIPYEEMSNKYKSCDLFIFASTCENMPNILVEAMSAGLPILCSNYGPMPECLGDAGLYMDPTDISSISEKLETLLLNKGLRSEIAQKAYKYSKEFSWERTSRETFQFLRECHNEKTQINETNHTIL